MAKHVPWGGSGPFKKQRARAPFLGGGPGAPRNPLTGELAGLTHAGIFPFVAMFQVATADTHDDYVICQGYDPRIHKMYWYEAGNEDKPGIAVAKPYGSRGQSIYEVGQMHAAILPLHLVGNYPSQNPGKAETTVGHPYDLDEDLVILNTDEGVAINWMFLGGSGTSQKRPKCHFTLDEALTTAMETAEATIEIQYGAGSDHDVAETITVHNMENSTGVYEFYADAGDWGIASYAADPDNPYDWYIDTVECP